MSEQFDIKSYDTSVAWANDVIENHSNYMAPEEAAMAFLDAFNSLLEIPIAYREDNNLAKYFTPAFSAVPALTASLERRQDAFPHNVRKLIFEDERWNGIKEWIVKVTTIGSTSPKGLIDLVESEVLAEEN